MQGTSAPSPRKWTRPLAIGCSLVALLTAAAVWFGVGMFRSYQLIMRREHTLRIGVVLASAIEGRMEADHVPWLPSSWDEIWRLPAVADVLAADSTFKDQAERAVEFDFALGRDPCAFAKTPDPRFFKPREDSYEFFDTYVNVPLADCVRHHCGN